jgi:UDP-N-acetylmuramate--alanine ligase
MNDKKEHIFMIGTGGMGMAPLAIYLRQNQIRVSGYDDAIKPMVKCLLKEQGIDIFSSGTAFPEDVDKVVYSSAIGLDHPCYKEACRRKLPLLKRGEMLAELVSSKKLIAVVGSHGKTTTTGMLIAALKKSNFCFNYMLGGLFSKKNWLPAEYNNAEWVVAEIDESDGTIEHFLPQITLAVNSDWDHPDFYPRQQDLEQAFKRLFQRTKGEIFLPANCTTLQKLVGSVKAQVKTFGSQANYSGQQDQFTHKKLSLCLGEAFSTPRITVPMLGSFNCENALAALAVTQHLTAHLDAETFSSFPGVYRRQTLLYESQKLIVYEDYAHHPTELVALLNFARKAEPKRKLVIVFQPHRYSRTFTYKQELVDALKEADILLLTHVYAAGETPLKGGKSVDLLNHINAHTNQAIQVNSLEELKTALIAFLNTPTILLFVGAGDISEWAANYMQWFIDEERWWNHIQKKVSSTTHLSQAEFLYKKTTLRVGGPARYYAEPSCVKDLCTLLIEAEKVKKPLFILGRGSNIIAPDEGFDGLIIHLNHPYWKQIKPWADMCLWVGAGAILQRICAKACNLGLAGFEFLEGIPGSLGGAIRMNAGAMGSQIFDLIEKVYAVTLSGQIKEIPRSGFQADYRNCPQLHNIIVVGAVLRSPLKASSLKIKETMKIYSTQRKAKQPREPNAGCIFKNPKGKHAGQIIEQSGFKGYQHGGMQVSNLHANFMINCGNGTSTEAISLIRQIHKRVKEEHRVELEPEVLLIGKKWEEVFDK